MRVAKRVAAGYAVLMLMMAGLVSYQVYAVHKLQTVNRENAGVNLNSILTAVQLIHDRDALEGCAARYFALRNSEQWNQFESARETFESGLSKVAGSSGGSERKSVELRRLTQFWNEFLASVREARVAPPAGEQGPLPQGVADQLERLRAEIFTVYEASKDLITTEADAALRTGERIQSAVGFIAGVSLVVGSFLCIIIVRSISIPLRALAEGTRAISEGKSHFRLDTSRSDEFSQIAKDFNNLAKHIPPAHQPE